MAVATPAWLEPSVTMVVGRWPSAAIAFFRDLSIAKVRSKHRRHTPDVAGQRSSRPMIKSVSPALLHVFSSRCFRRRGVTCADASGPSPRKTYAASSTKNERVLGSGTGSP